MVVSDNSIVTQGIGDRKGALFIESLVFLRISFETILISKNRIVASDSGGSNLGAGLYINNVVESEMDAALSFEVLDNAIESTLGAFIDSAAVPYFSPETNTSNCAGITAISSCRTLHFDFKSIFSQMLLEH